MERDLVQLFDAAKKAADTANAKGILLGQTEASRCVDALSRLRTFPVSRGVLQANRIEERLERLCKHKNQRIRSSASTLLLQWRQSIRNQERQDSAARKKQGDDKTQGGRLVIRLKLPKTVSASSTASEQKDQCVPCTAPMKGKDESRDKIRDTLLEALSRVSKEVKDERLKGKVRQCSPLEVAFKVEAVMFEKMGPFKRNMKNKYRSIMYNMRDPKNPDLRRNVLLGQVTPERLVDMRTEEMASNEIQSQIKVMKERALKREDAKIRVVDDTIAFIHEECFEKW